MTEILTQAYSLTNEQVDGLVELYAIAVAACGMTMEKAAKTLSLNSEGALTEEGARNVLRDTVAAAHKVENAFDDARVALQ